VRGTPGYFPLRDTWHNGSIQRDIWSLAVIILESDMEQNEYAQCDSEREGKAAIKRHIEKPRVCVNIKEIAKKLIIEPEKHYKMTLERLESIL
jgi:hypothetical protein